MTDYIPRDKALAAIKKGLLPWEIADDIRAIPAADVVEVTRCRDCKWKQGSECVRFADVRPFPDDFCSRGERREDE